MSLTKAERLREVYRRLEETAPATSAASAMAQLRDVLEAVEDELSGIAAVDPPPADGGGRMYFPRADMTNCLADGSIIARATGHLLWASPSGGLEVINRQTGVVEFRR